MKEVWEGQVDSISETLDNTEQLFKWTIPAIKEAKFVRIINTHLRATNKRIKDQVKDLQEQLELIHDELQSKGIKMTVIEEPIGQPSANK